MKLSSATLLLATASALSLPPHETQATNATLLEDDTLTLMERGGSKTKTFTFEKTPENPQRCDKMGKVAFGNSDCLAYCDRNIGHWMCHPNTPWPMQCIHQVRRFECGDRGKDVDQQGWYTRVSACRDPRVDKLGNVLPQSELDAKGLDYPVVPTYLFEHPEEVTEKCKDPKPGEPFFKGCAAHWKTQRCCSVYSSFNQECLEVTNHKYRAGDWCGAVERGLHTQPEGEWTVPDDCAIWRVQQKKCLVKKAGYPGDFIDSHGMPVRGPTDGTPMDNSGPTINGTIVNWGITNSTTWQNGGRVIPPSGNGKANLE